MADANEYMERLVLARTAARATADVVRDLANEAEQLGGGRAGPARALAADIKTIGVEIAADAARLGRKL